MVHGWADLVRPGCALPFDGSGSRGLLLGLRNNPPATNDMGRRTCNVFRNQFRTSARLVTERRVHGHDAAMDWFGSSRRHLGFNLSLAGSFARQASNGLRQNQLETACCLKLAEDDCLECSRDHLTLTFAIGRCIRMAC